MAVSHGLRSTLFDRRQNIRHDFRLRLRAEVAFAVEADADGAGGHVARADDQHGVDFGLSRRSGIFALILSVP